MSILYLGDDVVGGTSLDRARALERLGHRVHMLNPERSLRRGPLLARVNRRSGYLLSRGTVDRAVTPKIADRAFDLAWVGGGRQIGPRLVRELKQLCGKVVNYNSDDPFGSRDSQLWRTYLDALPEYDLVVVVRESNVAEAYARGATSVQRVWMSYDPIAHRPRTVTPTAKSIWASEVLFLGTWMPERGPFLTQLIDRGVPLSIYGNRWQRAREWPLLRTAWRGSFLRGDDQAFAIQSAKVCLGLLSKGNRDLHTSRSLEIPALGALLCAERTTEHQALYDEDREAVFWSSAEECVAKCLWLLEDHDARARISHAGSLKVRLLPVSNDDVLQCILDRLCG